jgi:hypothetical protein
MIAFFFFIVLLAFGAAAFGTIVDLFFSIIGAIDAEVFALFFIAVVCLMVLL